MIKRIMLLATVYGALSCCSANAQACHCAEDKDRSLKDAQKTLADFHNRKPMGVPAPLNHGTPRLSTGGGPRIHGVSDDTSLNPQKK